MISFPVPDAIRHRMSNLARENFALWMFIAQADLFEEAEEFISDDICDKIFCRCLFFEETDCFHPGYNACDSYGDNLPF